jgi:hypothetical protein
MPAVAPRNGPGANAFAPREDRTPAGTRETPVSPNLRWRQRNYGSWCSSVPDDKSGRPVKPPTFFVGLQQRVRAELKEMASIFEPKIADNSLKYIKVLQANARGAFTRQVLG